MDTDNIVCWRPKGWGVDAKRRVHRGEEGGLQSLDSRPLFSLPFSPGRRSKPYIKPSGALPSSADSPVRAAKAPPVGLLWLRCCFGGTDAIASHPSKKRTFLGITVSGRKWLLVLLLEGEGRRWEIRRLGAPDIGPWLLERAQRWPVYTWGLNCSPGQIWWG